MTNIVALNSTVHGSLRVQASAAAQFGDNQHFVPVIVAEFSLLAVYCPILLSKDANTGAFVIGAVLGFNEGENLFLAKEGGMTAYRPLNLQRAPFYTAGSDLAIDLDSPRVSETDGQLLFDQGKPTAYLESIMETFRALKTGAEYTRQFIEALHKHRLIEPIIIDVSFDDGTSRHLEDLYTINQDALRGLSDDTVLDMFRHGYLQLAYLMIASVKQVPELAQRKNTKLLEN